MCLIITKESLAKTKRAKARKTPITAWKLVNTDMDSFFEGFQWQTRKNISNRKSTKLTKTELKEKKINKGFHFFLEKPEECPNPNPCLCPCQCQCRYRCQYNKLLKVKIQPKDIVAIGEWEGSKCIVATKCVVEG